MTLSRPSRKNSHRSKTSPAKVLQGAALEAQEDLKPPRTSGVQQHLLEGGPTTTMLDLAIGILQRMGCVEANDPQELDFLKTCLKEGHSKTTLPCALLDKRAKGGQVQVQDMLLNMYGDPAPPPMLPKSSTVRRSRDSRLSALSESEDDGSLAVRALASVAPDAIGQAQLGQLLEEDFDSWSFDTFKLSFLSNGRPLVVAGHEAFIRNNLYYEFPIEAGKARDFLKRVEAKYAPQQKVPYHNNLHAADIMQSIHAMLGDIGFHEHFDNLSMLSIVFSAAIHDMGHDGRNNNFHVNVQDDVALTYNDKSVLENFHVSQAFRLLASEPEANLLSGLMIEQFASARKKIIEQVLGTDMALHFSHLGSFKAVAQKLENEEPASWMCDPEAASILGVMVLHAVDISGPGKSLLVSDRWTTLLRTEFFQQGDAEKHMGLPVSPLCDRDSVKFASSQVGFMQFIVQPTFELLSPLRPRVKWVILREVEDNMEVWKERKEMEAQAAQSTLRSTTADGTVQLKS